MPNFVHVTCPPVPVLGCEASTSIAPHVGQTVVFGVTL